MDREAVEALFEAALELEPGARADFLAEACGEDEGTRRAVLALLSAHERAEGVLEVPVQGLAREDVPERLGAYRVLREIGRGGMGTVYDAERDDGQFRRRVAIKVLRDRSDPELHARVLAERQILAALDHPNIARLLDGGVTADGRPYLVMEHVAGLPVDVYCDRMRLTVRERLRLFCVIARAVEHAHRNLVVHRDLKPSNILVTPDGTVKLLDFGVAKLLNPGLAGAAAPLTRERVALTPEYASPEQYRGEPLATGTDVYSLGVVLYELLTGRRPHQAHEHSPVSHLNMVCGGDVTPPSARVLETEVVRRGGAEETLAPAGVAAARQATPEKLARQLRGDIDAIVGLALRTEPARRYGTPELLALDIERHLSLRRVHAHQGSRGYAFTRFVRRHRTQVAAALVAAVALVTGASAALWQAGAARSQRDRAELASRESERITQFLLELFEAGMPEASLAGAVTARDLVERGVRRIGSLEDQPALQAPLLAVLGRVQGSLAEYEHGLELTRRALAHYQSLGDERGVLRMLLQQGNLERLAGEYRQAQETLLRALALQGRLLGPRHPDLGQTHLELARISQYLGELDGAEQRAEEAYALQHAAFGDLHPQTLNTLALRGELQRRRGNLPEAERLLRTVVELRPQVAGTTRSELLHDRLQLADVLLARGDSAEAQAHYRDVLVLTHDSPEAYELRSRARSRLAALHTASGELEAAERLLRDSHQERVAVYPPRHRALAGSAGALAAVLARAGRLDEAERLFVEAADIYRETVGERHLAHANAQAQIAAIQAQRGDYAAADSLLARAIALRIEGEGPRAHGLPDLLRRRAEVRIAQRRYPEAEALLGEAMAQAAEGSYSPGVRREVHQAYAGLYTAWSRPADAARHQALAAR